MVTIVLPQVQLCKDHTVGQHHSPVLLANIIPDTPKVVDMRCSLMYNCVSLRKQVV